jgi:polyhydroxybutyrate depolymerase
MKDNLGEQDDSMNKRILIFMAIALLSPLTGCVKAQFQNFDHHGQTRQYIYYSPSNLKARATLVFVLHGYTDDASAIQEYSGMNATADQNEFAVCYPRGTIDSRGNRFWNVGYDFHAGVTVDDVGFLIDLAQYLQKQHNLSTENTFATGMSNGGEMCYLLACKASSTFRAVAPVAGMMLQTLFSNCHPNTGVPLFEIHGTHDKINFFDGDIDDHEGWGAYPGIPFTIDYWAQLNGCNHLQIDTLPDNQTADSSYVISEKHVNMANGNQVWLFRIVNGGHDWPGSSGNMDINTSREIWSFFNQYVTQ